MDNSPLGKIPAEVRLRIYKSIFDHSGHIGYDSNDQCYKLQFFPRIPDLVGGRRLREVMVPLHVCKQMRNEAMGMQFGSPAIAIRSNDNFRNIAPQMGLMNNKWSFVMRNVPSHLRPSNLSFEYQTNYNLHQAIHHQLDINANSIFKPGSKAAVLQLARAAYPTPLIISISIFIKKSARFPLTNFSHDPNDVKRYGFICSKDAPVTAAESETILIKLPTKDRAKARQVVDSAFEERVRLFEAHRDHRMCHVRLNLRKDLERLAIARRLMLGVIDHIPAEEINAFSEQGK